MNERYKNSIFGFLDCTSARSNTILSYKKPIIASCCLYIAIVLVCYNNAGKEKNPSLRASVINSPEYKQKLKMVKFGSVINEAEDEVLDNANEELSIMEEDIDVVEGDLKERIEKSLNEFLINKKNLRPSEAKEIEDKINERLDDKVSSLVSDKVEDIEVITNDNLDKIDDETLKGKTNGKLNRPKLDNMKLSLEDYLKKEIASSENQLLHSLSKATKDIEKDVFKEEGIDVSDNELAALIEQETNNIKRPDHTAFKNKDIETIEADSFIQKTEDEVLETANDEISHMETDVYIAEDNLQAKVKKVLHEFLINKKNLSPSRAQDIEVKVLNEADDKVKSLMGKSESEIENIANEELDELDEEALDTSLDKDDINGIKKGVESLLKKEIDEAEWRLIQSLGKVTEDAEYKIFKEEGIDITKTELAALVEQETKNIINEGWLGLDKSNEGLDSKKFDDMKNVITKAEDEVLDVANNKVDIMEEDVTAEEKKLQQRIKKSLDYFLINKKNLSPLRAAQVEKKVLEALDDKVVSLVSAEEAVIEDAANENLDMLDEEALESNGTNDAKVNQPKLDNLKKSLEEYLIDGIADSENRVIKSLGKVTEDIETKIFREEGIDVSDKELAALIAQETNNVKKSDPGLELADEELGNSDPVITKAEDEVLKAANDEIADMEEGINFAEENLQERIQKALDNFLIRDKKLSLSKAKEVEEKVHEGIYNRVSSLINSKEKDLEVITNDNLDLLDDEALEGDQSKLDSLKKSLEEYLKKEIDGSESQLIQSLGDVTKDVETKVFKEEGIDVSYNELAALVEQETKNIKEAEISV